MITPPTRLRCSQGHSWEPAAASASPLVCPVCGKPPSTAATPHDPDQTVDQDVDRTIDLPTPLPTTSSRSGSPPATTARSAGPSQRLPDRSEVTQSMHFTPLPRPGSSTAGERTINAKRSSAAPSAPAAASRSPLSMPFTILRQHARGGLGLVNLARDEHINREVALKQILPQHGDNPTLKKRFLYEAQITGQLEHPSIVPVYTLGSDPAGNPYYVMRFVRGRTLDAIITEHHTSPNPIVFRELLRRFIAVCQAVAYAHSRGVIHRDLKPSNIMLGDYGETLVLDWGLAKDVKNKTDPALFADDSTAKTPAPGTGPLELSTGARAASASQVGASELTMQGQIIGTPAYMAPEQAEGRTELHGPVTDIYALGGILYKILTGQSPQAPTASTSGPTATRHLNFVESPPPSNLNQEVHPILEQICLRAMARDPAARYPRALELAQDIQRWLDENPLSFKRETTLTRLANLFRCNSIAIFIGLLVAAVILLTIVQLRSPR